MAKRSAKAAKSNELDGAEFFAAIALIEQEKGIPKSYMMEKITQALITAYKRDHEGITDNVVIDANEAAGTVRMFVKKDVVEEVDNPYTEISLTEARASLPTAQIGDVVRMEIKPRNFGRIAAQTARQVIIQGIREAEHNMIYDMFSSNEQVRGEVIREGDRVKVYVVEVRRASRGPQVLISRTHPGLVKRLFELEVPEIYDGTVEIRSIAREAGSRTKIAVWSADENVDPIGACVGPKGQRVNNVVAELLNEKVDIIKYSDDPAVYIAAALSPADVLSVVPMEESKSCRVMVPDDQLSLAIGKEGQNARLAAKLTGYKIDIKSQSSAHEWEEEDAAAAAEAALAAAQAALEADGEDLDDPLDAALDDSAMEAPEAEASEEAAAPDAEVSDKAALEEALPDMEDSAPQEDAPQPEEAEANEETL